MKELQPTALVTGAARRLGAAITRHLHSLGYRVAIHCNNSIDAANQLAGNLNNLRAGSAWVIQQPLGSQDSCSHVAKSLIKRFGRCDLLVNNASSFFATPLTQIKEQSWDELFSANAKAPLFLSQSLLKPLKEAQGAIINIADIHAIRPLKNHTIYCMAKAANIMLTKSLALELAPEVRVNGIAPGAILWPENTSSDTINNIELMNKIPMNKLGEEKSILTALDYLIQREAYLTGQIINIDGGRTLLQ